MLEMFENELETENPKAHNAFCVNLYRWIQYYEENAVALGGEANVDTIIRKINDWPSICNLCQSPIEEIMAGHLLFIEDGHGGVIDYEPWEDSEYASPRPNFGAVLKAQAEVGKYRADFLIECFLGKSSKRIAIECDGHDFHEKNREQAQRDKARDRFFATEGVTTLRFTGQEIYRDAAGCAREIEFMLKKEMDFLFLLNRKKTCQAG